MRLNPAGGNGTCGRSGRGCVITYNKLLVSVEAHFLTANRSFYFMGLGPNLLTDGLIVT